MRLPFNFVNIKSHGEDGSGPQDVDVDVDRVYEYERRLKASMPSS